MFEHLKSKVSKYYEDGILECKLIERKKLYGFDAGKKHRFIEIKFANVNVYNKVKNLWYQDGINEDGEKERRLLKNGYKFDNCNIELYEANIPPLLRFFHIREVSPSGWIAMPKKKTTLIFAKATSCDFEFSISYKNIIPLNHKEDRVPYKIMSFDIEASSSHGDFPVPIKSYKKLATNIVDYFDKLDAYSAGTHKKDKINQDAVRVFFEMENINMNSNHFPKLITDIPDLDVVITMGCNVSCPFVPCNHREDWGIEDPSGGTIKDFRVTRDIIRKKVDELIARIRIGRKGDENG